MYITSIFLYLCLVLLALVLSWCLDILLFFDVIWSCLVMSKLSEYLFYACVWSCLVKCIVFMLFEILTVCTWSNGEDHVHCKSFSQKNQIKSEGSGQNSQIVGSELCCFNWETNLHHSFLCCRKHSSPSPLFPLLIPHCTYVNICLHNDFFILSKNDGSLFYWLHFFPSIILDKCEDPTFSRWIFES